MSNEKSHFLARKIQDFQRSTSRGYVCLFCSQSFHQEPKLWEHAKRSHAESFEYNDAPGEAGARKQFRHEAMDKAQKGSRKNVRPNEPVKLKSSSKDDDSTKPNIGDEVRSNPTTRPLSAPAPCQGSEGEIQNIDKLRISQDATVDNGIVTRGSPSTSYNPLKRGAREYSGLPEPPPYGDNVGNITCRARHTKALSGGPFISKDPDFDREAFIASVPSFPCDSIGPTMRLFDPTTDNPNNTMLVRRTKHQEHTSAARRTYDPRTQISRFGKTLSDGKGGLPRKLENNEDRPTQQDFVAIERPSTQAGKLAKDQASFEDKSAPADPEPEYDLVPLDYIRQPETRPISHDQLVVEVKGIYAGLVMVEAKCIEVDENQSVAAQEKDPSRKSNLTNEQWQALIALHKQLLHEHHDFFLASQHPSASPALSRLAAKYSMPARMWRHGIHAFLEVLRHRLPESLDHMLAFIYIAYSMMALLYETVATFEDTWIECLGDLARYRMAIEDDDIRDREVWSGVARFWYSKAADKSPNVGRLYHHLAILARPSSLQQLSLYTKSLTCVTPFESARGSIMTLFTPILHSKESAYHRSSSLENVFIKAHATLFSGGPLSEFDDGLQQLNDGLLDNYIGRVTAKFKEQGVFAAVTNIAALFEYGALKQRSLHKSVFRLAFEAASLQRNQRTSAQSMHPSAEDLDVDDATHHSPSASSNQSTFTNLTASEIESSEIIISHASKITFITLSISLQRIGDKNVFPLIHVSFVFLWSLVIVEKAMKYVERDVPWGDICSFLNTLARPEVMTPRVWGDGFPKPSDGVGRPLPEDFVLRGQLYSEIYFPGNWFQEAMIDDEERALELPSMAAPRVERILWLGIRIASFNRWLKFDKGSHKFVVAKYGVESVSPPLLKTDDSPRTIDKPDDYNLAMPDARLTTDKSTGSKTSRDQLNQSSGKHPNSSKSEIVQCSNEDVTMTGMEPKNFLGMPVHPDPSSWSRGGFSDQKGTAPSKKFHQTFVSDTNKLEAMIDFDNSETKDPFKA